MLNNRVLGPTALFSKIIVNPFYMIIFDLRLHKISVKTLIIIDVLRYINKSAQWELKNEAECQEHYKIATVLCNYQRNDKISLAMNTYDPSCIINIYEMLCEDDFQSILNFYDQSTWKLNLFQSCITNPCDGHYFLIFNRSKRLLQSKTYNYEDIETFIVKVRNGKKNAIKRANKIFNYLVRNNITDHTNLFFLSNRMCRTGNLKTVNDWILKNLRDCISFINHHHPRQSPIQSNASISDNDIPLLDLDDIL